MIVLEVYGASKDTMRNKGKSDPHDAVAAARVVLAGDGIAVQKDERTNVIRTLRITRRSGVKARTSTINQIKAILFGAPDGIHEKHRRAMTLKIVNALAV